MKAKGLLPISVQRTRAASSCGSDERSRLAALRTPEEEPRRQGYDRIIGVDEAGRGPLAGPVVAAACYIPIGIWIEGVNDSKQLKAPQREALYDKLTSHPEIHYGIGVATVEEIDAMNIYQATLHAMRLAIAALPQPPDYLLVDGNVLPTTSYPGSALISGDTLSYLIAAASILAKEYRDRYMRLLDGEWPCYGFASHKGYGTRDHLEALREHGPAPCHRRSFSPVKDLLCLAPS